MRERSTGGLLETRANRPVLLYILVVRLAGLLVPAAPVARLTDKEVTFDTVVPTIVDPDDVASLLDMVHPTTATPRNPKSVGLIQLLHHSGPMARTLGGLSARPEQEPKSDQQEADCQHNDELHRILSCELRVHAFRVATQLATPTELRDNNSRLSGESSMAWYSWFSHTYDGMLERLYSPHRAVAFRDFGHAERVLVVPCGTGQDLPFVADLADEVVGVDLSAGMVRRAEQRVARAQWSHVSLHHADIMDFDHADFDRVVWSLGLTVVPDFEAAFDRTWHLLRPGGRMLIFDVWAEQRTFQTWQVEKLAQADLNRRVWEPLEQRATNFSLSFINEAKPRSFGGKLFVASGSKGPEGP